MEPARALGKRCTEMNYIKKLEHFHSWSDVLEHFHSWSDVLLIRH